MSPSEDKTKRTTVVNDERTLTQTSENRNLEEIRAQHCISRTVVKENDERMMNNDEADGKNKENNQMIGKQMNGTQRDDTEQIEESSEEDNRETSSEAQELSEEKEIIVELEGKNKADVHENEKQVNETQNDDKEQTEENTKMNNRETPSELSEAQGFSEMGGENRTPQ